MRYVNIALISGLIFAPLALNAAEAVKSWGETLWKSKKPKLTRENCWLTDSSNRKRIKDLSLSSTHVWEMLSRHLVSRLPPPADGEPVNAIRTFARALSKGSRS